MSGKYFPRDERLFTALHADKFIPIISTNKNSILNLNTHDSVFKPCKNCKGNHNKQEHG